MRGLALLVGAYVLCVALAAPAALSASEEPAPAEVGTVEIETTTIPDQPAADVPTDAPPEVPASEGGGGEAKAHSSAEFAVAMRNIEFRPGTVRIRPGDTVEWKNEDQERHNAIGRDSSFETPVINTGETSSHTFKKAGSYPYFCSLHQGMNGTVKVSSSSSGGGGGSGGNGTGGVSTGTSTGSGGSSFSSGSTSSLPSTGEDALGMALVGGALLWLGAAVGVIAVAQLRESRRSPR